MQFDYAKGPDKKSSSFGVKPLLYIGLALIAGTLAVWGYMFLSKVIQQHHTKAVAIKKVQPIDKKDKKQASTPGMPHSIASPEFDFYTLLPKLKVPVHVNTVVQTPNKTISYLIQVAALKDYTQARALQYQLLDKGFHAQIISPKVDGNLYRITIGPYAGITKANEMLELLKQHQWYGLVKKA